MHQDLSPRERLDIVSAACYSCDCDRDKGVRNHLFDLVLSRRDEVTIRNDRMGRAAAVGMMKAVAVAKIVAVFLALFAVAATTATNCLSVVSAMTPLLVCALAFEKFLLWRRSREEPAGSFRYLYSA